jgi:hypothetical protein
MLRQGPGHLLSQPLASARNDGDLIPQIKALVHPDLSFVPADQISPFGDDLNILFWPKKVKKIWVQAF